MKFKLKKRTVAVMQPVSIRGTLLVIGAIKEHVEDLEDGYLDGDRLAELIAKKIMEYRVEVVDSHPIYNDDATTPTH